jgi:hypothetical protein
MRLLSMTHRLNPAFKLPRLTQQINLRISQLKGRIHHLQIALPLQDTSIHLILGVIGGAESWTSSSGTPGVSAFSWSSKEMLWLRARLLPTESKDDTGTKAQIVLNIGSRVGESGTEITDIYGTKGKVLG